MRKNPLITVHNIILYYVHIVPSIGREAVGVLSRAMFFTLGSR